MDTGDDYLSVFFTGGFQSHPMLLREGRPAQPVEGELCHHGQGHALRRHPVLFPRTLQNTARRPLRIPGKVSLNTVWLFVERDIQRWLWVSC